jgi:hypothetical protein
VSSAILSSAFSGSLSGSSLMRASYEEKPKREKLVAAGGEPAPYLSGARNESRLRVSHLPEHGASFGTPQASLVTRQTEVFGS